MKQYWPIRHEIYLHNDVLFYKKRILVPDAIKNEFLEIAHKTHQSIISCKKIIQDSFYYPGVSSDIEKIVLNCTICQQYSKSNQRQPLSPHPIPSLPWEKISADFMTINQLDFLVIVDYLSKYAIVNKLTSKTASSIISSFKNVFSILGLPQEIFSDNGPPFNSFEYISFARKYNIDIKTSSPYYPKSNGMIERAIQTVKGLFKKAIQSNEDPFLAILYYNTTPKQDAPAPCSLLMGRKLRTLLPVGQHILKPEYSLEGIHNKLSHNQSKQKYYHDQHAKQLNNFVPGQQILVQNNIRDWKPGVIINKNEFDDYTVRVNNTDYRRNRQFLKPRNTSEAESKIGVPPELNNSEQELLNEKPVESARNVSSQNTLCTTRSGRFVIPPTRLDL